MPTNCLSVFDHFVKLTFKGFKAKITTIRQKLTFEIIGQKQK